MIGGIILIFSFCVTAFLYYIYSKNIGGKK